MQNKFKKSFNFKGVRRKEKDYHVHDHGMGRAFCIASPPSPLCNVPQRESTVTALWGGWGTYASRVLRGRLASHSSPVPKVTWPMSPTSSLAVVAPSCRPCNSGGGWAPRRVLMSGLCGHWLWVWTELPATSVSSFHRGFAAFPASTEHRGFPS